GSGRNWLDLEEILGEEVAAARMQAFDPEPVAPGAEPGHRHRSPVIPQEGFARPAGGPEHLAVSIDQLQAIFIGGGVIVQVDRRCEALRLGRDLYGIHRASSAQEAALGSLLPAEDK